MGNKLNILPFGLSIGITWSIGMIILGVLSKFGYGTPIINLLSSLYIGTDSSILGIITGGLWGFFDGLIGSSIIAMLYNVLSDKLPKCNFCNPKDCCNTKK